MKILALEFSSSQRSVAVGEGEGEVRSPKSEVRSAQSEPGEFNPEVGTSGQREHPTAAIKASHVLKGAGWFEVIETGPGGTQAFAMIQRVLRDAGMDRREIECVAIAVGPGSYTGIRAAIAIGQGWQLATGVKLVPLSSVECLAAQTRDDGFVGRADFIIDAQRNEFYLAGYEITEAGLAQTLPLKLAKREEVAARATARDLLVGPEARRWFPEARELFPRAETLGRLASRRRDYRPGDKIEPIYLRETTFVKAPTPRFIKPG